MLDLVEFFTVLLTHFFNASFDHTLDRIKTEEKYQTGNFSV